MRPNALHRIPSRPHAKSAPIGAKGPQDCIPLSAEQFTGATVYVAKAFLSAALLPKDFFEGVPLTSALSQDSAQRTLLAAYVHFKQNGNLALSFFCRYKALLMLHASTDLSQWVTQAEGSEYAVFSPEILELAARHPMLASGQFEADTFIKQLQALTTVIEVDANGDAVSPESMTANDLTVERLAA